MRSFRKKLYLARVIKSDMNKLILSKSISHLKIIVFSCVFASSFSALSQSASNSDWVNSDHKTENLMGLKQGWFVGGDFGSTLHYGAISLYNRFPKVNDFSKSFGNGYSLYGGKKFKFGLAAEAQVFKGNILGYKISPPLYERKFTGNVLGYSINAKYNLSQLFFREKNDRKFFNRLGVYLTAGFGQVYYRSILYKLASNNQWYIENATGYKTKGVDSAGINSAGGVVTTKAAMASAFILPIGGKLNFKLNKKTDIVLDIYYATVFSKSVDSWDRTWTKDDKYLYMGLGLCYNFGRGDEDEVPDSQRLLRPHERHSKAASTTDSSNDDMTGSTGSPEKKGLFKRKSSSKKEDKDLEIKLKLYELQLKLFEMQFLTQ
jgi:hypothetical protein